MPMTTAAQHAAMHMGAPAARGAGLQLRGGCAAAGRRLPLPLGSPRTRGCAADTQGGGPLPSPIASNRTELWSCQTSFEAHLLARAACGSACHITWAANGGFQPHPPVLPQVKTLSTNQQFACVCWSAAFPHSKDTSYFLTPTPITPLPPSCPPSTRLNIITLQTTPAAPPRHPRVSAGAGPQTRRCQRSWPPPCRRQRCGR